LKGFPKLLQQKNNLIVPELGSTRRSVMKAAAWSTPLIFASVATPAFATSAQIPFLTASPSALTASISSSLTTDLNVQVMNVTMPTTITATLSEGWTWVAEGAGQSNVFTTDSDGKLLISQYSVHSPDYASSSGSLTLSTEGADPLIIPLSSSSAVPSTKLLRWTEVPTAQYQEPNKVYQYSVKVALEPGMKNRQIEVEAIDWLHWTTPGPNIRRFTTVNNWKAGSTGEVLDMELKNGPKGTAGGLRVYLVERPDIQLYQWYYFEYV
jgi:hypothetical protein